MLREQHSWLWRSICWLKWWRLVIAPAALLVGTLLPALAAAQVTEDAIPSKPTAKAKSLAKSAARNRAERAKPADVSTQADGLVKDALYYEIYGDQSKRDQLLSQARDLSPNFAPARWQSGQVKYNERWLSTDQVSQLAASNTGLTRYTSKRNETPDTAAGHLSLARWCESRGFDQQARAHYTNVLDFQPDHAEARGKLGFRRLNGLWLTENEVAAISDETKQLARAIETWSPTVNRIREGLVSSNERNRKAAEQELAKIEDIGAIPVLERTLSAANENAAVKLVGRLAAWNDPQATRSLSRQAIYSPWEAVRQLASHKLQGRRMEEYVPNLLDLMRSTVQVNSEVFQAGNQLVLREFFVREGPNAWELLTIDTAYSRNAAPNGDANDTLSRAIVDMRRTSSSRQTAVAAQNERQNELNERAMECLTIATGQTTRTEPADWWQWWNDENEMAATGEKSVVPQYTRSERVLDDERFSLPPQTQVSLPRSAECLAAGTPVWTMTGTQPIERLRVGDLVLSQDTESGELAYKPVLRRTVRPAGPVFQLEIDGQTYRASGGHLFWIAGEGWTKARHLRSGNVLHCCTGTASLNDAKEAASEPTYNIVVADFNTYFIGENKILSHDVTLREPSRAVVPGLLRE
jgi:hypothetical protein